jgi:ubiquinone/menaquinone biosynthesis C-methylase UbiE
MDHFRHIYSRNPAAYQRLIAAEDVDGNLLRTLRAIVPLRGQRVLDVGSGTGRIPLLLRTRTTHMVAVDLYAPMLWEQRRQRDGAGEAWPLIQADARRLPFAGGTFDLVLAGWALGHFCEWYGPAWQREIHAALAAMARVARPGGTLVICETLGTGVEEPQPPAPALARYYRWLEESWGFRRETIATDYHFPSVADAEENIGFFFGAELAREVRSRRWRRVPEWTGVWHRPV